MDSPDTHTDTWKDTLRHELAEYGFNVIYLTLVFASFTEYRRLLLAAHDISYTNYWVALVEALILGKVIMIGSVFRLGRGLEAKALIFPTLHKTLVFSLFVGAFKLIEHVVTRLWHGGELVGSIAEIFEKGFHEQVADSLVVFVALIPFFAFKELGRVLGRKRIWALFFHRRDDP